MIKYLSLIFLFFIFTPGILWSYPKKTNKYLVGLLHAVLFALSCKYVMNFTQEGMEQAKAESKGEAKAESKGEAKDKTKDETKDEKENEGIIKEKKEEPNTLTFVLGDNLSSDSEVINKINKMEGPPKIEGADQIFGDGKSYLLFTNQKGNTNKLENLLKIDILDMIEINKFIKFHKDYPDI